MAPSRLVADAMRQSKAGQAAQAAGSILGKYDKGPLGEIVRERGRMKAVAATSRRDYYNKTREQHAQTMRDSREEAERLLVGVPEEWGSMKHLAPEIQTKLTGKLRNIQKMRMNATTAGERAAAIAAMDRVRKAHNLSAREELASIIAFEDPRPRNRFGMFSGGSEMGLDPNQIHTAYKAPFQQRGPMGAMSGLAKKLRVR